MNIKEAKEIDMVDYLSKLGHDPTRKSHPDYWYRSPLRDEKTASFKVNRKKGTWKDFATGEGGNIIDFGILYFKCNISQFLGQLGGPSIGVQKVKRPASSGSHDDNESQDNKIKIISLGDIRSLPLFKYFRERRIADEVAHAHLKEALYELRGKNYYALAFENDKGGYELRNKYFKGSSAPKDSTFIDNGSSTLSVFEGNFDFLSHRTIALTQKPIDSNFLILNSTAFFEAKLPLMLTHKNVELWVDNDKTGDKCCHIGMSIDKEKFKDARSLYKGYNDLNDWMMNMGKSLIPRQSP